MPNANLRTQLQRIIRRAGLKPWPKLFHNLRATRETELAEEYPLHVVCAWIGNSKAIAAKHYLQVNDAHFEQAARPAEETPGDAPERGAKSGALAAQNEAQPASADICREGQETTQPQEGLGVGPVLADMGPTWRTPRVEDNGLEPMTFWLPASGLGFFRRGPLFAEIDRA